MSVEPVNRNDCPLDGNCQTSDIISKCIASMTINPAKIYLGRAEGNFKKRYLNMKPQDIIQKQRKGK